jgi:hypothetical protein
MNLRKSTSLSYLGLQLEISVQQQSLIHCNIDLECRNVPSFRLPSTEQHHRIDLSQLECGSLDIEDCTEKVSELKRDLV